MKPWESETDLNDSWPRSSVENDVNLMAKVLSCLFEIPIVILRSTLDRYVLPFLPTLSLAESTTIIYLAHNVRSNRFYNTKDKGNIILVVFILFFYYHRLFMSLARMPFYYP